MSVMQLVIRSHLDRPKAAGQGESASLVAISGETEKRLKAFGRIYDNKNFTKQAAYTAFAGVTRKKSP